MYANVWLDTFELLFIPTKPYLTQALNRLRFPCLNHRKAASCWSLRYKVLSKCTHLDNFAELLSEELQFCSLANEHHKRHYYLWYYRLRVATLASTQAPALF